MSDETSEGQVADPEPAEEVEPVETEAPPGGDSDTPADEDLSDGETEENEDDSERPPTESESAAREVGAGNAGEPPKRSGGTGLSRTTTTGDPEVDLRQPGAGAVEEGEALDRERSGDDVRGHPEDHGTLLPD